MIMSSLRKMRKMSKKIILATNNKGKISEITDMLSPLGFEIISMKDAGIDAEIDETGTTFKENAHIKAKYIYDRTKTAVIADDSGLEVDHLDGAPGVYSHRYAGEDATDEDRFNKLLGEMKGVPESERTAAFVCVMCYIDENGEEKFVRGECNGRIGFEPIGSNGFGYDPVFMFGNKSLAEMSSSEKNKISHRARALEQLLKVFSA